jgi:ATP-binding cassette, subfamily B, bacterial PglK
MRAFRKIRDLLSPRERLQACGVFALMVVMALLQVAGIASILPFLALVADPNVIERNAVLSWLYHGLGFTSETRFLVFVGFSVLAVFTTSNLSAMLTSYAIMRFSWGRSYALSLRLLTHYLRMPYVFFLGRNSSELANKVLAEIREIIGGIIIPAMQTLAHLLAAIAIVTLLVVVDPLLAALSAIVLGGSYLLIYKLARQKLAEIGRKRLKANEERYRTTAEGLAGIKEIKILGREAVFLDRYAKAANIYVRMNVMSGMISRLPHYLVEILAFGGLLMIALYLLIVRGNLREMIPLLGLYAFASFRLMPAIREIYSGVAQIRSSLAPLDHIHGDLQQPTAPEARVDRRGIERLPLRRELVLEHVTFGYPTSHEPVLRDLTVTIRANTWVAFVGATGSGKTTTVDLILGLLRPDRGRLLVDGTPLTDDRLAHWQKNIGYVPQQIYLSDDTIAHNIAFGVPPREVDYQAVERAAQIANIHDFVVVELSDGYRTVVGERGVRLSGGQRQRIGIARAVYHDPDVLVMDEATSALDNITEQCVLEAVERMAGCKTLILIAHRLSTVRKSDEIFLLDKGRLVARGSYDDLLHTSPQFQAMARGTRLLEDAPNRPLPA